MANVPALEVTARKRAESELRARRALRATFIDCTLPSDSRALKPSSLDVVPSTEPLLFHPVEVTAGSVSTFSSPAGTGLVGLAVQSLRSVPSLTDRAETPLPSEQTKVTTTKDPRADRVTPMRADA